MNRILIALAVLVPVAVGASNALLGQTESDTKKISHLIRQLGSDSFEERQAATRELDKIGEPALPALRKALSNRDAEIVRSAKTLIDIIETKVDLQSRRAADQKRRLDLLVKQLGDESFEKRQAAAKELDKLGEDALSHLLKALADRDAEIVRSSKVLVEDIEARLDRDLRWAVLKMDGSYTKRKSDNRVSGIHLPTINGWELIHFRHWHDLEDLSLGGSHITDTGLMYLAPFRNVRNLSLSGTNVTDSGLNRLQHLTQLRELELCNTRIKGQGLTSLKNLKKLERIVLTQSDVTDEGLAGLSGLDGLARLDLTDTKIGDAGVSHLKSLKSLSRLSLKNTQVTDKGLATLSEIKSLSSLLLSGTKISDSGLAHLRKLERLEYLSLENHELITDKGLEYLSRIPQIKEIWIGGTSATSAGIERLRKALPGAKINGR